MRIVNAMTLLFLIVSTILPLNTTANEGRSTVMTDESSDGDEDEDDPALIGQAFDAEQPSSLDLDFILILDTFTEVDSHSLIRRQSTDFQVPGVSEYKILLASDIDQLQNEAAAAVLSSDISEIPDVFYEISDFSVYDFSDLIEAPHQFAAIAVTEPSEAVTETSETVTETSEDPSEDSKIIVLAADTADADPDQEKSADTSGGAAATAEEENHVRTIKARVTAYAPFDNQSGICNDGNPSITSTGQKPGPAIVAVDPAKISYGTKLKIEGFERTFVAGDTGSALRRYSGIAIDVFFETYREARRFGVRYLEVEIID